MAAKTGNFLFDIARGEYGSYILDYVVGVNPVVPSVGPHEDLWGGDGIIPEISTASLFDIVSSSANDAAAGTGARTVKVYGITGAGAISSETVTMNGTNVVSTVGTYVQIYHIEVLTVGSNASNFGTIDAQISTTDHIRMTASYNRTHHGMRVVPTGYRALILDFWGSVGKTTPTAASDFGLYTKVSGGVWQRVFMARSYAGEPLYRAFPIPFVFAAGTRFKMSANSDTASTVTTGGMTVLYEAI